MNRYLTIGNVELGISTPFDLWFGYESYTCRCRVRNFGPFFYLVRDPECRCAACDQYACDCPGSEE